MRSGLEERTLLSATTPSPSDAFELNSLPGADKTIYLDFTGHTLIDTPWNRPTRPVIQVKPFDRDGQQTVFTFSEQEKEEIVEIWQRVAEDFSPFDVNVTTQDPGIEKLRKTPGDFQDREWGVRVLFTATRVGAGNPGGAAKIDSFKRGEDIPVFVWTESNPNADPSDQWIASTQHLALTATHEIGHSLGLEHDGYNNKRYYDGHWHEDFGWNSIMARGALVDDQGLVQWSKGEYSGANNQEDDLAIITKADNGIRYRADDFGNTFLSAKPLGLLQSSVVGKNENGVIERNTDSDWFEFIVYGNHRVQISAKNFHLSGNLDIGMKLYKSKAATLSNRRFPITARRTPDDQPLNR